MPRCHAQDANFWESGKTDLSDSIGEIGRILDKYGCDLAGTMKRKVDGKTHLIVNFQLNGMPFHIEFRPLPVDYGRGRRDASVLDQLAEMQMGRIAVHWLKSMLAMVDCGHEEVLMPYLSLPARSTDGRAAATNLQQQGLEWLAGSAQQKLGPLALPASTDSSIVDAEYTQVKE